MSSATLYNDNSINILRALQPGSVDCIITDYPWKDKAFHLPEIREMFHREFVRLCGDKTIIVFGPVNMRWFEPADQILFWTKPISTKNTSKNYSNYVEEVLIYQGENHVWNDKAMHWSNYTNILTDKIDTTDRSEHRKPPSLIERLIRIHTNPGQTILDPFAGSMVVGEVGLRLGRSFIGCELNKETFDKNSQFLIDMYGSSRVFK